MPVPAIKFLSAFSSWVERVELVALTHPLSKPNVWQDIVHQPRGCASHTPAVATRANATLLARKCNEQLMATALAHRVGESMSVDPTLEIRVEFSADVKRQWSFIDLMRALKEGTEVVAHNFEEHCLLRAVLLER